jgi:hypothetical protein
LRRRTDEQPRGVKDGIHGVKWCRTFVTNVCRLRYFCCEYVAP